MMLKIISNMNILGFQVQYYNKSLETFTIQNIRRHMVMEVMLLQKYIKDKRTKKNIKEDNERLKVCVS